MLPLSDSVKTKRIPFVMVAILLVNVVVFLYQLVLPEQQYLEYLFQYALVPSQINFTDLSSLLPFLTSMFMHGDFLHIISNMVFLWVFGDNVEDSLGHILFILFYLVSGFFAAFSQYIFSTGSDIPMLGASGAIAAILGYYFVLHPNASVKTLVIYFGGIGVQNFSAKFMLGFWGLTQLIYSIGSIAAPGTGGVAFMAHLGGFVFGLVAGFLVKSLFVPDNYDEYTEYEIIR